MKLAIIGAGKMGSAIMSGALSSSFLSASDIGIYDIDQSRLDDLHATYHVNILTPETLGQAPTALLAVKPQYFGDVAPLLADRFACYLSIMAGTTIQTISEKVASQSVIRLMPNLGASVNASATAMSVSSAIEATSVDFARGLFESVGEVYDLPESLIDAFTGLAGSGPGFIALIAEALADGGVRMGLPRELAQAAVAQVLAASGELLKEKDPAILKNEVASPGGTTIAGIKALEQAAVRHALMQAVEAATLQGQALNKA